jgi:hypothetical protein
LARSATAVTDREFAARFFALRGTNKCAVDAIELDFLRIQPALFAKACPVREHTWFAYIPQF